MYAVNTSKPYILYIEDDPDDVELLNYVLKETDFDLEVVQLNNGIEAIDFLQYSKGFSRLPAMIFLDVNLSKMDGKETVVFLRADKDIAQIPMAVLSTSSLDSDIAYFRRFNVPYIVKPGDIKRFQSELVELLKGFLAFDYDFTRTAKKTDAA